MQLCSNCGSQQQDNLDFCIRCNTRLTNKDNERKYVQATTYSTTYNLGKDLENFTEFLLKRLGYSNTIKRKKVQGKSATFHEIDILSQYGNRIIAIECKNYSTTVGIERLRDFKSKLDDIGIAEGIFVTNSNFSVESQTFANLYDIQLWDGKKLSEMHYQSNIGRLDNQNTFINGEKNTENQDVVIVNNTLPILIDYETIRKVKVVNPQQISILHAELIFLPFYLMKFSIINKKRGLFAQKETVSEEIFLINAISGEVLSKKPIDFDYKSILFSKHRLQQDKTIKEKIKDLEINIIMQSITNIITRENYKIKVDGRYAVTINKSGYPAEAAERKILEDIVERNNVKYDDVKVLEESEILVPKWFLIIECQGITYVREAIASTNTFFHDEIELCPKDTGKEKKKTYAICEICGIAICSKHIIQENGKYACQEHKVSKLSSVKKVLILRWIGLKIVFKNLTQNLFKVKDESKEPKDNVKIEKEEDVIDTKYNEHVNNSNEREGSPIKW